MKRVKRTLKLNNIWILFLAVVMLLAACTPAMGSQVTPTTKASPTLESPTLPPAENEVPAPEAVTGAREQLAEMLNVPADDITIRSIEETNFPNTCLGLPEPDEVCGQAIVRGYQVMVEADGKDYEIRASLDGKQVRFGGDLPKSAPAMGVVDDLPAVAAARAFLAGELNVDAARLSLVSAEAVQWPNSCLGISRPEETCLAAITPGYKVIFEVDGQQYQVNTNEDGSAVRMAPVDAAQQPGKLIEGGENQPAVQAAVQMLSQQMNATTGDVEVVEVESVNWRNGCLGVEQPDMMCTQAVVPGYRVVLEHQGKRYEFHTDEAGGQVVEAVPGLPETATNVLVWEQTEGTTCTQAEIGVAGVSFGPCGSADRKQARLQPGRESELAALFVHYGTFDADTKAGSISFHGQGKEQAGVAEMRSMAEWAKLVVMEAEGEQTAAAWGQAITWHQEGGIAGFCSDLVIYRSGLAQPTSCKSGAQGRLDPFRMSPADLEQLYEWVDTLSSFEFAQNDNVAADGMQTSMTFTGTGTQKATPAQQQEIAQFAARIYLESTR